MTRPRRYLIRMVIFLVLVGLAGAALYPRLHDAFMANVVLNGLILGVFVLGVVYAFRQVLLLGGEIDFLEQLMREGSGGLVYPGKVTEMPTLRLLGPMGKMLRERRGRASLSATSMRTLTDGIKSRIEESHEISRYFIGLMVFLGLLGTFWGLVETVGAVGQTINSLSVGGGDVSSLFEDLKLGLERPLSGMGTAFSSSLFGLAGSLALGFLELQSGQAHNRFMNELEEWLSGMTRLSAGGGVAADGDGSVPAYLQSLLEQTADSLESLQRTIQKGEDDRQQANRDLGILTERLTVLTDQMRTEQEVMRRLAETHSALRPILTQLAESSFSGGMDDATRDHIRSMSINLQRIAGELSHGRDQAVTQVREEIRSLHRTIARMADENPG